MKPPQFDYACPKTLPEALETLGQAPDDTKLLAGGQSLVPMLNMRLVRPQLLLDLNRVPELQTLSEGPEGSLQLGAMVRQRRLETDPVVLRRAPLLAEAAGHVAYLQIRMRGTLGGSLAHADPTAELPAALHALRSTLTVQPAGKPARQLAADQFFVGAMTTALEPDEILTAITIPALPPGTGWAFDEITITHGSSALVGVAALLHVDERGRIDLARLALCGVDGTPYAPAWLDAMLLGELANQALFERVADRVRTTLAPAPDRNLSAESRRVMAAALVGRALAKAHRRATGQANEGVRQWL